MVQKIKSIIHVWKRGELELRAVQLLDNIVCFQSKTKDELLWRDCDNLCMADMWALLRSAKDWKDERDNKFVHEFVGLSGQKWRLKRNDFGYITAVVEPLSVEQKKCITGCVVHDELEEIAQLADKLYGIKQQASMDCTLRAKLEENDIWLFEE